MYCRYTDACILSVFLSINFHIKGTYPLKFSSLALRPQTFEIIAKWAFLFFWEVPDVNPKIGSFHMYLIFYSKYRPDNSVIRPEVFLASSEVINVEE
jgi:hypothetical protein